MQWTPEKLIAFEHDIAAEFNAGKIRAPIHLEGDNEQALLEVFADIRPQDWVCGTWRMHYKCLLKGVSPEQLKTDIMVGRSITLCYPEHRIISSAIVGGILPIALGIAMGIKARGDDARVHCFLGDMTALGGMFHECVRYAAGHGLIGLPYPPPEGWAGGPLRYIIEDNGLSVGTPTMQTWGTKWWGSATGSDEENYVDKYEYKLPWPHSGAGKRVEF